MGGIPLSKRDIDKQEKYVYSKVARTINWFLMFLVLLIFLFPFFSNKFDINHSIINWIYKTLTKGRPRTYEPAQILISTIGIGGFAISSINGYHSIRRHGVLTSNILRCFFPCNVFFSIIHTISVLIGLYACQQKLGYWVAAHLSITLICFFYSTIVLLTTVYSHCFQRITIKCYIRCARKHGQKALVAFDLMRHISGEYHNHGMLKSKQLYTSSLLDTQLLIELLRIKAHKNCQNSFSNLYELQSCQNHAYTQVRNALYCIPYLKKKKLRFYGDEFTSAVALASSLWKTAFAELQDKEWAKHSFASTLLNSIYMQDESVAITLFCGLLLHLRLNSLENTNYYCLGWKECTDFIKKFQTDISSISYSTHLENYSKIRNPFVTDCMMISSCLYYWEVLILHKNKFKPFNWIQANSDAIKTHLPPALFKNQDYVQMCMTYALTICRLYNHRYCYPITRKNITIWEGDIYNQICQISRFTQ